MAKAPVQTNWSTDVVFIPGRRPGKKKNPYGKFPAKELWTPLGWSADGDFTYDMGAFTVGKNKKGKKLKKAVGALGFAYSQGRIQLWSVFGYPAAKPWHGNKVITCSAQHAVDDDIPSSDGPFTIGIGCDMTAGSSGGPWDPQTAARQPAQRGDVVRVPETSPTPSTHPISMPRPTTCAARRPRTTRTLPSCLVALGLQPR